MQFLKRDCSFFFHLEDFFTKKKRLAAKEASFFSQELVETIPEINIYSTVKFSIRGKNTQHQNNANVASAACERSKLFANSGIWWIWWICGPIRFSLPPSYTLPSFNYVLTGHRWLCNIIFGVLAFKAFFEYGHCVRLPKIKMYFKTVYTRWVTWSHVDPSARLREVKFGWNWFLHVIN